MSFNQSYTSKKHLCNAHHITLCLSIRELQSSTAFKKLLGQLNQISSVCGTSACLNCFSAAAGQEKNIKLKKTRTHTFRYFIWSDWLFLYNVFHLWRADKTGYMWHNKYMFLCLTLQMVKKIWTLFFFFFAASAGSNSAGSPSPPGSLVSEQRFAGSRQCPVVMMEWG